MLDGARRPDKEGTPPKVVAPAPSPAGEVPNERR